MKLKKRYFELPPKGDFQAHGYRDPLRYYYHPLVGFLYRARIESALKLLQPPYESILELGYGSGMLLPTLASYGKKLSAIDINSDPAVVNDNLKRFGVEALLTRGDIYHMDYGSESFDLIVALSIFEHITDIERVLAKAHRFLRPGGHCLVGMPRVDRLMQVLFPLIGHAGIKRTHVTNYVQFLKQAKKFFKLTYFKKMPSWVPGWGSLYYNMLFIKN